jgi:GAF domain-containing protein
MSTSSPAIDTQRSLRAPARLQKLSELDLLDSPFEAAFDRLTHLASLVVDAPVSLVSIVDADRQFFKSFVGLPEPWASKRETPLSHSFCQYVVSTGEPLVVEDARKNALLRDNLAIPELNVIGYLGMPLQTTDGHNLGSFCVIDSKPRAWTQREIEVVRELALSVMTEVALLAEVKARRKAEDELLDQNRLLRRVTIFTGSTLDYLATVLNMGTELDEIKVYVRDAQRELDRLR